MARELEREQAANGEKHDLYFSVDVETSGFVPMYHSMFSFGAAVVRGDEIVGTFERNLDVLNPFIQDIDNRRFWDEHPVAWQSHRKNIVKLPTAMSEFHQWVKSVSRSDEVPVFLAYPAAFDFAWMMGYGERFSPVNYPFGHAALCMQSYAAALLNVPFSQARQKNWPNAWQRHMRHTHIALNDAMDQAKAFIEMQRYQFTKAYGRQVSASRSVTVGGNISGSYISTGNS